MKKINERFLWALHMLNINPADDILEIGCGSGILAGLVENRLNTGTITSIDRSPAMLDLTEKSNSVHIREGRLACIHTDLLQLNTKTKLYEKIIAFNVPFFQREADNEIGMISRLLKPEGRLFIFYQAPYNIDINSAAPITKILIAGSFNIVRIVLNKEIPKSVLCIEASVPGY